ncbi:hypothetical protein BGZ76_005806, partial [Entomortierella beljakovae]
MAHPVRGSSRTSESNAPHPQVVLSPLPPRDNFQPNVASYDPYETDYTSSPHPSDQNGPDNGDNSVKVPLESEFGSLSLDNNTQRDDAPLELNSLPLHFSDPEAKKPVERNGYVDDTRYSVSDDANRSPQEGASGSFEPGVTLNKDGEKSPQKTDSVDSTHSAVRAYAAANPNAPTYSETSSGGPVYPPGQPGYGGQDYGHGQDYQRPPFRGPPQPYGQYPNQDPRYQQYPGGGYGGNGYQQGGYQQDPQYDQYGQPYGQEFYQDQYHRPPYGGGGGGGGGYPNQYDYGGGGGYRPQGPPPGPGYGPPGQFYGGPGGPGGPGLGGANLHSSPSMRGPPPGRG